MPDETQFRELQAIISDVKEHLLYLDELGIKGADNQIEFLPERPHTQHSLTNESLSKAPGPLASPLKSAVATAGRVADHTSTSSTASGNMSDSLIKSDRIEVTATPKETPAAQPPSAATTLFDSIMSKDETSRSGVDETLEDVWNETRDCTRCVLCEGRTHVVNSEGNRRATLMFVGEAPGADEDAQARPFVGRAGQLLNKIIEGIGFKREDVFIGNVNRCRPPQNRTPTPAEGSICKPFILREIDIVKPKVIVVLGNVAMRNLLATKEGITKLRGKFQDYRGIKVMPTFHPAYLLRDPSKKRETWEDMKTVRDYLSSLIHE